MGVGGSLDFLAGAQKRAPRIVQALALEWLWRMLSDPRRLVRRYVSNLCFLATATIRLLALRYGPMPARAREGPVPPEFALLDELRARRVVFPAADAPRGLEEFRVECAAAAAQATIVVDMAERSWVSSRELGLLLELSRVSRAAGRRLHVYATHPRLARLIRFGRLDLYIDVHATAAEAVTALRAGQKASRDGHVAAAPEDRIVVVLPVELTAANVEDFRARFQQAWQDLDSRVKPRGITVDASAVEFIDSAALGFLVALRKRMQEQRGDFRCGGFHGPPLQTIRIAKLESLLSAQETASGASRA
jgi:anti-anti-sigma factor